MLPLLLPPVDRWRCLDSSCPVPPFQGSIVRVAAAMTSLIFFGTATARTRVIRPSTADLRLPVFVAGPYIQPFGRRYNQTTLEVGCDVELYRCATTLSV
eukprot:m.235901 g.235901  ORF g.235901 m.235901 type:complete len:99 (+) comp15765_c0_seq11:505-801(+)